MSRISPDAHKKRLLSLKAEILAEGDDEIEPSADASAGLSKPDEDAQPLAEMSQAIASSRNRNRAGVLARIKKAMERLQADPESFGECTECGEAISQKRLELMPYVELCVECQQALDEPRGPTGRRHLRDYR